ncbi:MAG: ABC transporter ATP-binding protein [Candidatus Bipolaricaulota bacterium]
MLTVDDIHVYYGEAIVLEEVSLEIGEGEIAALIGANGAGKTTTLKSISGLLNPRQGKIHFQGERIDQCPPEKIVKIGISQVPEGRHVFEKLSVSDNLKLGAYTMDENALLEETLNWVHNLFPILEERRNQQAGTLSGGQQQMLAIGRALMSRPTLLMLDEPSLGLMPTFVEKVFETIETIHQQGTTVLLVEQNVQLALETADRGYVLQNGKIKQRDRAETLLSSDLVREAYLGL